jgi:hypothetical protein
MHEVFYGPKALESLFEDFLAVIRETHGSWHNQNIQPNRKLTEAKLFLGQHKQGICPHYQLIEVCAEIMGIKAAVLFKFEHFCGRITKEETVNTGCLGQSFSTREMYIPFTTCFAVMYILKEAVRLARSGRPAAILISSRPTEGELERVSNYVAREQKYRHGREIIELWAKTIPRNLGTKKGHYPEKELKRCEHSPS